MNTLDINIIKTYIPHRFPFLLIDKVIDMQENVIKAIKNVTINEPFFQGHYPSMPIMPGVLQVEALAQAGAVLAYHQIGNVDDNKQIYFASLDGIKFRKPVIPGDQLILEVTIERLSSP